MSTEEFLAQPLAKAIENPETIQDFIDHTVKQTAALRQLLTISKAANKPGRKRSPSPRKARKPAEEPAGANGAES